MPQARHHLQPMRGFAKVGKGLPARLVVHLLGKCASVASAVSHPTHTWELRNPVRWINQHHLGKSSPLEREGRGVAGGSSADPVGVPARRRPMVGQPTDQASLGSSACPVLN